MQDREHRAATDAIQKFVGVEGRGQRSGLRFAVSHDNGDDEVRVVEGSAESVRQAITELAAFMDGTGSIGRAMTADASWKGKLFEEFLEAGFGLRFIRINFRVKSLPI